jgi:hypothetical protein
MSRGLGTVQRGVLDVVVASAEGVTSDAIASELFGGTPTATQKQSVRRAIRDLRARGLVEITTRWDRLPRKSLKRFIDLAPCDSQFCELCAQRKKRTRLDDWHRKAMRANAKQDPAWLEDLKYAEASGFVHATASGPRVVEEKPDTVDLCFRKVQVVSAAKN